MSIRGGVRGLQTILIAGGAGALHGLGRVWLDTRAHGYESLGYRHTLALAYDAGVWNGLPVGLVFGLLSVIGAGVVAWLAAGRTGASDEVPAWSAWLRDRLRRPWSYVLLLLALGGYMSLIGLRHGGISDEALRWLLISAALLAVAIALTLMLARRAGRRGGALPLGFLAFAMTLILGSFRLNADHGFSTDPDHLASLGLLGAIALVVGLWLAVSFVPRRPLVGLLLAALLPAAVLGGTTAIRANSPPSLDVGNPHNVVLIGIDTLRADHTTLGVEGESDRPLTPELRKLAARATRFDAAVSQAPWTLPAFSTILTGRYPAEHGAYSLTGLLRDEELTLAEILREAGYRTSAVVSHDYVARKHGFGQGFDAFDESNVLGRLAVTSADVTDRALEQLGDVGERPFFLFVHYFDPHYAYIDHAEWSFSDGYQGWLRQEPFHILNFRSKRQWLEPEDVQWLVDLYDEDVAYTDREIGRLLDYLDEAGLADDTAVVVVADHGEEFLERGWLGHTVTLNRENIHVPLIVALPGIDDPVATVERPVETRSIFSTVLDYLAVGGKSDEPLPGSLLPTIRGEPFEGHSEAFSMSWLDEKACIQQGKCVRLSSVRIDDWKLILDYRRGIWQLYDLGADPLESTDLGNDRPEKLAELRDRLLEWERRMADHARPGEKAILSDTERQRLKSLGYL